MAKSKREIGRLIRHRRVRKKVHGTPERPRLCVYRSLKHIYGQIIDDANGVTIAAASTLDPELRDQGDGKDKKEAAKFVGLLLAKRALDKGVEEVVFDRGGYLYHGRVASLADGAREGGLKF